MLRGADDDLVRARGGLRAEEVGLAAAVEPRQRVDRAGEARPPPRRSRGRRGPRPLAAEDRVEVRDRARAPARRVGLAAAGAVGPDLGRRAVLAALAERAALGRVGARSTRLRRERVGALGAAGREDRPQPGELVDADLGRAQLDGRGEASGGRRAGSDRPAAARSPRSRRRRRRDARRRAFGRRDARGACGSSSGLSRSIGSGKTTVVLLLTPISTSVCR